MKAVYFAWVRERIGLAEEDIAPPREVETVRQLVDWLAARGDNYAAAFANPKTIRAALDIVLVVAAARHRGEAFAAAEFLMDYLKTRAPFWKKERRTDGTDGGWVEAKSKDDEAAARWETGGGA